MNVVNVLEHTELTVTVCFCIAAVPRRSSWDEAKLKSELGKTQQDLLYHALAQRDVRGATASAMHAERRCHVPGTPASTSDKALLAIPGARWQPVNGVMERRAGAARAHSAADVQPRASQEQSDPSNGEVATATLPGLPGIVPLHRGAKRAY